ncbi:hypothetical protein SAMN05421771_1369 [Granulicella pectinivorans]|uniref:Uncharacterized protein n=1 Tax=Granulicella pectinivorans TaxID=474950 RepID=A0A1I6LW85_9BACT|nr:hypothetical protein SAMN05421771_1369 [Granulicella pectinivorans]
MTLDNGVQLRKRQGSPVQVSEYDNRAEQFSSYTPTPTSEDAKLLMWWG